MSAEHIGNGNGEVSATSVEQMLALQSINEAVGDYAPRAVLGALITFLATWIVENNLDPDRIVITLIKGIDVAEKAAQAELSN